MLPDREWEVDKRSVGLYHVIGSIPAPSTIYEGVHALEAGSSISFKPGAPVRPNRFWTLSAGESEARSIDTNADAIAVARSLFVGAVRSRLVSDVPVGLFLSGGFDSSALLSRVRGVGTSPSQTVAVCVDFEEPEFSEFPKASSVARHYGGNGSPASRHAALVRVAARPFLRDHGPADKRRVQHVFRMWGGKDIRRQGVAEWCWWRRKLFGGYQSFRRMRAWSLASRCLQALPFERVMGGTFAAYAYLDQGRTDTAHGGSRPTATSRVSGLPERSAVAFSPPDSLESACRRRICPAG